MAYSCVAHRATATVSLPAAPATDSAAKVPVVAQETEELALAVTDSLALVFQLENRFYCNGLP